MHKYAKIKNLFKFDIETKQRKKEFTCPEFEYLQHNEWIFTEKIDGTNIRVIFDADGNKEVRGRTDKAQLHPDLIKAVLRDTAGADFRNCTLYGEGYGAGIQKGGHYRPDKGFILFDIFFITEVDNGYFLPWMDVKAIAATYKIPIVPEICSCVMPSTLWAAHEMVQRGLESVVGEGFAEGLVGRPAVPVRGIKGERIIVKIKHRDYYQKELQDA